MLTAAELAPGNAATLAALTDPSKRPPTAREPIPAGVMEFQPASPVRLPDGAIARALKDAKRGSAPGLSGARVEHYKLLLDDADSLGLLSAAATRLARAQLPPAIARAVAMARVTALQKPAGGVRGIATGDVFRRLVSRALAAGWAGAFDEATRPYQFALSTHVFPFSRGHKVQ